MNTIDKAAAAAAQPALAQGNGYMSGFCNEFATEALA